MKRTRHSITTLALWLGAGLLLAGADAEGNTLAGSRPNFYPDRRPGPRAAGLSGASVAQDAAFTPTIPAC